VGIGAFATAYLVSRLGLGMPVAMLAAAATGAAMAGLLGLAAAVVLATTLALAPLFQVENTCPNRVLPYEPVPTRTLLFRNGEMRAFAVKSTLRRPLARS
jgi:predicted lysophospholipase L1 biosynthesis ABC-type transport system permease subunit